MGGREGGWGRERKEGGEGGRGQREEGNIDEVSGNNGEMTGRW